MSGGGAEREGNESLNLKHEAGRSVRKQAAETQEHPGAEEWSQVYTRSSPWSRPRWAVGACAPPPDLPPSPPTRPPARPSRPTRTCSPLPRSRGLLGGPVLVSRVCPRHSAHSAARTPSSQGSDAISESSCGFLTGTDAFEFILVPPFPDMKDLCSGKVC